MASATAILSCRDRGVHSETALKESNSIAGDYVINFAIPTNDPGFDPATGRHTINLTGVLPEITNSNLTINGPGSMRLTIRRSTGGFYRILNFAGVVETATISGITFNNGFSTTDGGAVAFVGQALNINDCAFIDSTSAGAGGGLSARARLNVNDSSFSGNFQAPRSVFLVGAASSSMALSA